MNQYDRTSYFLILTSDFPTICAEVAELADALGSGLSG
jgi:hypothetical protein